MPSIKESARLEDAKETKRITEVRERFNQDHTLLRSEMLGSEEIFNAINDKEAALSYIPSLHADFESLPLNSLLYSKIFVRICHNCLQDAALIKPYLERGLIIPVLTSPLSHYKNSVIEQIIKYPHIGWQSLDALIVSQPCLNCPGMEARSCPHNKGNYLGYKTQCNKIKRELRESIPDKQFSKNFDKNVLAGLYPLYTEESYLLSEIENIIETNKLWQLNSFRERIHLLRGLRISSALNAIPGINYDELNKTNKFIKRLKIPVKTSEVETEISKKWITESLGLVYNPNLPIEEYLDIILPRKRKINTLINGLIQKENTALKNNINDEIWKINKEIASSKRIELLNYFTSFPSNNLGLISGLIVGGVLGASSGSFFGCGSSITGTAGVLSGLTTGRLADKRLKLPPAPRKTIEWIKEKIETPEEKIFAKMLATSVPAIQVWSLRNKLQRTIQKT